MLKDKVVINDQDINWVESILGDISFDDARRKVIKSLDSIDIQACPGSGKTTVLVAKLAILARKWPGRQQGICVLSHTNVAREEIQDRLGKSEVGRKLLSYPHFIGTFHSFFDTYIALPWIKSKGISVNVIDTEFVISKRWGKLDHVTQIALSKRGYDEKICEAKCLPLKWTINRCGENTDTYKKLKAIVAESIKLGEFTYDELLLLTENALDKCLCLPNAIQNRFPLLFIDEAQDTSTKQWDLVNKAFSDDGSLSIRQGFGDINQAIYSNYSSIEDIDVFPRPNPLTIENSKRFDVRVATLANSVSPTDSTMIGESTIFSENDIKHCIFLYDRESISKVVPTFADHVLNCFTDEQITANAKAGCHAIGMVHKGDLASDEQFPKTISDYWNNYNPNLSRRTANPKHLIEFFRMGNVLFQYHQDTHYLVDWIVRGLRRYINMNSSNHISLSTNAFSSFINHYPHQVKNSIRVQLLKLIFSDISSSEQWDRAVQQIKELCDKNFNIEFVKDDILSWVKPSVDSGQLSGEVAATSHMVGATNTLVYSQESTGRDLNIQFGSIHSIKGQTHLATLVLETHWHKHNIKSILPYLLGNRPRINKKRDIARLKCHYVALTRARGIICMAMPSAHVDPDTASKLQECGWDIISIV